jgi:hypothetical protein
MTIAKSHSLTGITGVDKFSLRSAGGFSGFVTLLLCFAWLFALPAGAVNPDSGSIGGFVRDGEGKAVAGASVSLTSHSATPGITHSTSGPAGEYHFAGLSDGEYSLGAEMAGYAAGGIRVVQVTQESNAATVDLVLIRNSARTEP